MAVWPAPSRRLLSGGLALALTFAASSAGARDLFQSRISVDNQTVLSGTNSLTDFSELFDEDSLSELFPGFTPASSFGAALDLRGVDALLSSPANSPTLRLQVPAIGIDVSFDGSDLDDSQELLEAWLEGGVDSAGASQQALTRLLTALLVASPVDPVAGNPNSLQSRMFARDFSLGTLGPFLGDFEEGGPGRIPLQFRMEADYGYYASGPYDGQTLELDLVAGAHAFRRVSLVGDVSLLYGRSEGEAQTVMGSLGMALQGRILDGWNLALAGRFGISGSVDLGALAALYSVSAVSHARWELDWFRLELKNMIGFSNDAGPIEIEGLNLNYDITNVVLRNGIELSRPLPFGVAGRPARARLFLIDSEYLVDDLFLEHSDEVGIGIGLSDRSGIPAYDPIRLDLSWVVGRRYDALSLRLLLTY